MRFVLRKPESEGGRGPDLPTARPLSPRELDRAREETALIAARAALRWREPLHAAPATLAEPAAPTSCNRPESRPVLPDNLPQARYAPPGTAMTGRRAAPRPAVPAPAGLPSWVNRGVRPSRGLPAVIRFPAGSR